MKKPGTKKHEFYEAAIESSKWANRARYNGAHLESQVRYKWISVSSKLTYSSDI